MSIRALACDELDEMIKTHTTAYLAQLFAVGKAQDMNKQPTPCRPVVAPSGVFPSTAAHVSHSLSHELTGFFDENFQFESKSLVHFEVL